MTDDLKCELAESERCYHSVCEALGAVDKVYGLGNVYPDVDTVCDSIREIIRERDSYVDRLLTRERESWHEEDGVVLWWTLPLNEPPYVGTPLDDDFPEYVTHWTPLILPLDIEAQ
jgi:hypothetical protein